MVSKRLIYLKIANVALQIKKNEPKVGSPSP